MIPPKTPETLTVLYDGDCPLCRREMALVKGQADRRSDSALCFVDISRPPEGSDRFAADRPALLARFHVERPDGSRLDGAAAFVAMWHRLPGWRWLARLSHLPGVLGLLERAYCGFLKLRPVLQRMARRLETRVDAAPAAERDRTKLGLSLHLVRELRSDHAGETGAVFIYRGIAAMARWRGDTGLLSFAQRHGNTEAEHLRLVQAWLPPAQRSRLLGPWRLAGWLIGALPALAGRPAVYATIAAVETFVDRHYQQQVEHLQRLGGPEGLLPLLMQCQSEERHHREEAAALMPERLSWPLRAWCALVGSGSAVAVSLARRL